MKSATIFIVILLLVNGAFANNELSITAIQLEEDASSIAGSYGKSDVNLLSSALEERYFYDELGKEILNEVKKSKDLWSEVLKSPLASMVCVGAKFNPVFVDLDGYICLGLRGFYVMYSNDDFAIEYEDKFGIQLTGGITVIRFKDLSVKPSGDYLFDSARLAFYVGLEGVGLCRVENEKECLKSGGNLDAKGYGAIFGTGASVNNGTSLKIRRVKWLSY